MYLKILDPLCALWAVILNFRVLYSCLEETMAADCRDKGLWSQ